MIPFTYGNFYWLFLLIYMSGHFWKFYRNRLRQDRRVQWRALKSAMVKRVKRRRFSVVSNSGEQGINHYEPNSKYSGNNSGYFCGVLKTVWKIPGV